MTKKVKSVKCGTCGNQIQERDETISISTKSGTTTVFHKDWEGCSKSEGRNFINRQVPSHSQLQLATLSLSKWDE